MSSIHHHKKKEMTKLFHNKIQVKKTKIHAMFNLDLQVNIMVEFLGNKLRMDVCDHPSPYPLSWVNKDT